MIKSSTLSFLFLFVFLNTGKAQVFWTERFENNCTSKCTVDSYTTGPNGQWTVKSAITAEGTTPNNWFISCAVPSRPGGCNDQPACFNSNSTLHISSTNDASVEYTKAPDGITDRRLESPKIDLSTKSNVKIGFDFICRPDTNAVHLDRCDLVYSLDGTNWIIIDSNLISTGTCGPVNAMWLKYEKMLPAAVNNKANVQIGFRWRNKATTALNTGFAVDSIRLSVAADEIKTGTILGSPFCACGVIQVPFDATGLTINSGNRYTAQLSDPNGSFASPLTIGSLPSSSLTGVINCFIPCSTPAGTAYRVRVISDNLPYPGTDNGVNLTISAPIQVTVTPNPDTVCAGFPIVLRPKGGDPGGYTWYDTPPYISPLPEKDSLIVTPTANTLYVLYGQKGSCIDSVHVRVVVQARPTVNVTNDTTCIGLGAVLKATGGTKYLWGNGSTKDSIVVFPTKDTMMVVSITKGYCTIKDTGYVKVYPKINVSVNSPTICEGQTATLTATGALTYKWNNGKTGSVITVNPVTTTSYIVTGVAGACEDTAKATVTVIPKPDVKVETPKPVCEGETVTLTATGATTYTWIAAVTNPNLPTITVKTPISRWYTVIGFTNACPDSATVFVTIDQRPNVEVNSPTICLGGTATLKALGAAHYEWQTKETTDSIFVSPTQNTIYSVIGFSENRSCTDTAYSYVTVGKPVKVDISGDLDIFSCETTILTATPTDGTYEWSIIGSGDGKIDCETCPSTGVTPPRTMAYVVTYRSPIGCIGKDTALVEVTEINSYFLATALTPNGDGVNDVVQVHGRGIDHVTFMIFDRIGEKVFETHEIEKGWDGTYLGLPMNSNVFVYRLEIYFCNGDVKKESGNITILK